MKPSYVIMPLLMIISSTVARFFTDAGMSWYKTLKMPPMVPPGWVFGTAWQIIFVCITLAAIIIWERGTGMRRLLATKLFVANLLFIPYWCFLFFYQHKVGAAVWCILLNELILVWWFFAAARISKTAALLILPNITWLAFAFYLNYHIWKLNAAVGIYRFL